MRNVSLCISTSNLNRTLGVFHYSQVSQCQEVHLTCMLSDSVTHIQHSGSDPGLLWEVQQRHVFPALWLPFCLTLSLFPCQISFTYETAWKHLNYTSGFWIWASRSWVVRGVFALFVGILGGTRTCTRISAIPCDTCMVKNVYFLLFWRHLTNDYVVWY